MTDGMGNKHINIVGEEYYQQDEEEEEGEGEGEYTEEELLQYQE